MEGAYRRVDVSRVKAGSVLSVLKQSVLESSLFRLETI